MEALLLAPRGLCGAVGAFRFEQPWFLLMLVDDGHQLKWIESCLGDW